MTVREVPLWQDLRGLTGYRVFGALIFDEVCQESGLKTAELVRRLRRELRRQLSRQTLAAWRHGDQSVPNDVMLASAAIAGRTLADAAITVAVRVFSDQAADPGFAEALRRYYGHGRLEMLTEPRSS
jgi:hypothetical protein